MITCKYIFLTEDTLELNEIAMTSLGLADRVAVDLYQELPKTGSFIIIDRLSNVTVGAGMICQLNGEKEHTARCYSQAEKELNAYIRKNYPEWGCIEL